MPSAIGVKRHHVLDRDLRSVIDLFFGERDWKGLYLTGGTCLAEFYFGHRLSIDMDLFTQDRDLFQAARRVLGQPNFFPIGRLEPRRNFPDFSDTLLIRPGKDPIKIDLVLDLPPALGPKVVCENIWLDSLPDLVANKLGCLIQREEVKDYLDLFYLLPAIDLSPRELIELGRKKDAALEPLILAHQIQYIQKVSQPPSLFLANVPWKQVQIFFARFHNELLDELRTMPPL